MYLDDQIALAQVANGSAMADLLIKDVSLINPASFTIDKTDVAISDGLIAGVIYHGRDDQESDYHPYKAKKIIDGTNLYMAPGFIDSHMHIESTNLSPFEYARLAVPHGSTTIFADAHEIANVCGLDGLAFMLASADMSPLDINFMLPSCVPATEFEQAGAILDSRAMLDALQSGNFFGIGEMMNFPAVVAGDREVYAKLFNSKEAKSALKSSYLIDGHAPGLKGQALNAYIAAGIFADHECTSVDEALDKLKRGMIIMMREGSCSHDLSKLKELLKINPLLSSRICLCTDDKSPKDGKHFGFIDNALRILVDAGIDPVLAISCATLNPARVFGLEFCEARKRRGLIAPGRRADFVLLKDLSFKSAPHQVYIQGMLCAQDGSFLDHDYSSSIIKDKPIADIDPNLLSRITQSIKLPSLKEEYFDFEPTLGDKAIDLSGLTVVTAEHSISSKDIAEYVACDENGLHLYASSLQRLVLIERYGRAQDAQSRGEDLIGKHIGRCFAYGFNLKNAALASSIGHDSHNVIVIGDNAADMLKAVEQLGEGGFTLVSQGELKAKISLPYAGLLSDKDADTLAQEEEMFYEELFACGYQKKPGLDPLMPLIFAPLPVIPKLRLTPQGLFDVERFDWV